MSEPKDKLDITASAVVSGPEDAILDWRQIDWRAVESQVRRLRQRIFTASKAGDLQRVRRLQRLMPPWPHRRPFLRCTTGARHPLNLVLPRGGDRELRQARQHRPCEDHDQHPTRPHLTSPPPS
jgi:hypothetical protein